MKKFVTCAQAVSLIKDGDHIAASGSGGGVLEPDSVYEALEERFLHTGHPHSLTVTAACGFGDKKQKGINRFAHPGMIRRLVGGHWAWSPRIQKMALDNKIEAYNFPQGVLVSQYRELAAKRAGLVTKTGLHTFVDPRIDGGKLNSISTEDLVSLLSIEGEEWLHYKPCPVDVAILRGSAADEEGNISICHEAANGELLAMAQAAHNNGGQVIVQVKERVATGAISPRDVAVPGFLVDAIVLDPGQWQTRSGEYNAAFIRRTGEVPALPPMPLDARKIIARRAAMELAPGSVINLGVGISAGVAAVIAESGAANQLVFTIEQGLVGGVPAHGDLFGTAYGPAAMLDAPSQFDFYGGGGLDACCLGIAQMDQSGNVNVSKFGDTIAGCGGFIDISQSTSTCIFCGTFTAGGLEIRTGDGTLSIEKEGRHKKCLTQVEHITFSGQRSLRHGQRVLYITERAVFRLSGDGIELIEVAPGIDVQRDILPHMEFSPVISAQPRYMESSIFSQDVPGN